VLLFANFARPALSFVMAPVLEAVAGEHALHYPQALLALPDVVLRVGAAIELVWLPLVTAWSVMLFAAAYRGEDPHLLGALRTTLARAPRILVVGAPLVALRTFAATITKAGIAEIAHRPMHGVAQGALGVVLEILALGAAAIAVGAIAIDDARLRELGWRFDQGFRDSGGATLLTATVLAGLAAVMRVLLVKWTAGIEDTRPDLIPLLCLLMVAYTSAGGLLFSGASAIVHSSLPEDD